MQNSLNGKVAIVTGANSGIGKMTAVGLARAGATVVMACRDLVKSEPVLAEVRALSGSDRVELLRLDLASLASVRAFVDEFTGRFDRLDVLVNNAGLAPLKRSLTADGFESQFGVHHLGHFLLTTLLLPTLERSAPSRVLVVTGSAQKSGTIKWDDLQSERKYSMLSASGQSRLANLLFMRALVSRVHGVTVNAIDPGTTATGLSREFPAPARGLMRLLLPNAEKGARTAVYLAISPEVTAVTGKLFHGQRQVAQNPIALDDAVAERLWRVSEELTRAR